MHLCLNLNLRMRLFVNIAIKLKNIVVRRNQIVHEGDCLSTNIPLIQQQITSTDTEDVINFITELVDAIDASII